MTTVEIYKKNSSIIRYRATGHSEYADYGEDIVCAALSMALQMALGGIQEVLDIYPKFEINDDGFMEVDLEFVDTKGKEKEMNALLDSMFLMVKQLSKDYPKNIKLVEKEEL